MIINGFSQTLNKLDEMHGFKDFKLGDSFEKWQAYFSKITHQDSSIYGVYSGKCCKTAFYEELDNVVLKFNQRNELDQIFLKYKNPTKDIEKIRNDYVKAFGESNYFASDDKTLDLEYLWLADQTILRLHFDFDIDAIGWNIMVIIETVTDKKIDELKKIDF